jgi:hypothetical protein
VLALSLSTGAARGGPISVEDAARLAFDAASGFIFVCGWTGSGGCIVRATLPPASELELPAEPGAPYLTKSGVLAAVEATASLSRSVAVVPSAAPGDPSFLVVGSYHEGKLRIYSLPECALVLTHTEPPPTSVCSIAADPGGEAISLLLTSGIVRVIPWPLPGMPGFEPSSASAEASAGATAPPLSSGF